MSNCNLINKKLDDLINSALKLRDDLNNLNLNSEFEAVYNTLNYAFEPFKQYLEKWGFFNKSGKKRAVFMGMNPGPWGMAQTGVPFGEINIVKGWLGIHAPVYKPEHEHSKYPVTGFSCKRSEVSGKRLWGLFKSQFIEPENFFNSNFVINYCPLLFIKDGRNFTPDKLKAVQRDALYKICDGHLREVVKILEPEFLVGIGNFAYERAEAALNDLEIKIIKILHPSPASPLSNKNWPEVALNTLKSAGVF